MENEDNVDSRTIFCPNLSKQVTEELLYELFLQAGPVERVRIPPNNNYGFVTYKHVCSVEYAIEIFKDTELCGDLLKLRKRHVKNRDNSNYMTNDNQNSNYNPILSGGNNMIHMSNMYQNMMPQNNMMSQNNMMPQTYGNMYQNSNYYSSHQTEKYDRSRSPPKNRHNSHNSHNTPRGRYDNNRPNKRYDDYDKYDQRSSFNERHNRKRHKR